MDWITHEEDVWFEFRGNSPHQLVPGRFYKGTVDGYADFGVFVDLASNVTGLLHRSELDRRLESLEWEPGDEVFVQVKNVRDNGNIDLGWSIRQSDTEFRGARIHDPDGDADGQPVEKEAESSGPTTIKTRPQTGKTTKPVGATTSQKSVETESEPEPEPEPEPVEAEPEPESAAGDEGRAPTAKDVVTDISESETEAETAPEAAETHEAAAEPEAAETVEAEEVERVRIDSIDNRVGEVVRVEGEIASVRQTGGPTVFELRDETAIADCAAFVEAGVRAYPSVEVGDYVRIDGEVERRRGELQIETEDLTVLEGADAETIKQRLADALSDEARPDAVAPLAAHEPVAAVGKSLLDAAEAIRRAVLESRPIVVRHTATADGYAAGAAVERAVLPLIRDEHPRDDAEYHYFTRRPLEEAVYGMDAATNDVTRMLEDRDRHDEKLPLVLLLGAGSTAESLDGLGLLGVYGSERVVVDAAPADDEVAEEVDVLVNPPREGADARDLSVGALASTLSVAVNEDVRDGVSHLPAVSYWENCPQQYLDLAADHGFDADRVRELREAVALEAYYQSYQDKRELIADLLFDADEGLAGHVSEQFRIKLEDEIETAQANLERRQVDSVSAAVLDSDAYSHRFDFPPTGLLVDELHRRTREGDAFVTVALGMDELYFRSTGDLDLRAVVESAAEKAPAAGLAAAGIREGRIEFLTGARDEALEAVLAAAAEQF
ncbi:S1 RNA-binding domain-containing protein [Haloferax mediterranei ATCC 33500]|uniref:DNA-binding protein n=1 Tax=Haloferax mediterranei (strain ATCC 33500 / DSM 1411 / JCM 8866 / NBRC 14739 / NCIMB 2177 / R-4) TaxID=523841 RepID=I3R8J3_HALMT|nr:OB-fold nucleic acid binding domain-containing protein [Haloferax mediterranei]AFK20553.1 RecJ-like exonuclease [Haloferax mediterranei ATCC 33500]AHZ23910.1 DNA-binding protein [Haloferax mediterranei ATCC 33500]ELZ98335.1 RecJ-like exonuclease [Haloferax mediterranei ATCC 33500]MDX5986692.1 OB-fold nucleic acid binding domain-containing protein [Haloferax mediterranei ATCC 33500]QCQ76019.1 S1 RNA-binding domain-containing protein [Haloferax mediterranei ATCC 33500]